MFRFGCQVQAHEWVRIRIGGVLGDNLRRVEQGLHGSCNADYVGCSSFDAGFSRAWNHTVLHPRLLDAIALCTSR